MGSNWNKIPFLPKEQLDAEAEALLDYKFSLLHEKGELVNSMYIRKADFLKEDLHAYDNDIGYGDI